MVRDRSLAGLRRFVIVASSSLLLSALPAHASDAVDKARGYFEADDHRAAVIELKNALQSDPGDIEARLLLGTIYLDLKDGASAEKELRRAADLGADPALWRLSLIEGMVLQGNYSDALDRLETAGELPLQEQARALSLRGEAQMRLQQLKEASQSFDASLALDPDNERAALGKILLALAAGDDSAAASDADALLARLPDSGEVWLVRAELYRVQGDLAKASEAFSQAAVNLPHDIRPLLGHAVAAVGLRDLEGAKKDLDRADGIEKDLAMTRYLRGLVAFQEKDWAAAKGHLERVLAVAPANLQSQLLLGIISFSDGDLTLAEEYLSRVVSSIPGNLQAVKVLAATRIKQREPKGAIEILEPLASSQPDPQLMALLGSAYMLAGDQVRGQDWLSRAVELSPDIAALRTQLALTLLAGGETDKAITELQSAVDLGQEILQADVLLVLAHLKNKQFEQALEASRALEQRKPSEPVPYNLTGLAYLAQGDKENARERFEKALELDPKFVTAELNLARIDVADDDLDAAQARYERVLAGQSGHMGALLGMAALAERHGDGTMMISWLEKAQDANQGSMQPGLLLARSYIKRKEGEKAVATATNLASRFPNNEKVLEMLARAQTLTGETSSAIRTFEQLANLQPSNPQLQYLLGGSKWKEEDLSGARTAFERAINLKQDFVDARWALASVELQDGRIGAALDQAKSLQQDFPNLPLGYRIEGEIYLAQKRPSEAVRALQTAYEKEKTSTIATRLAQAYASDNKRSQAIDVLIDWLEQQPDDQGARSMLAMQYQIDGRDKEAIQAYELLRDGLQDNVVVLNNLAWLYQKNGDPRALDVARRAYELDPNRPEIADTYGWILVELGQAQDGLSILQQAYLSYPTQTEIGYHVAVALHQSGRDDEAVNVLRRLLRETPNFEQASEAKALLQKIDK